MKLCSYMYLVSTDFSSLMSHGHTYINKKRNHTSHIVSVTTLRTFNFSNVLQK